MSRPEKPDHAKRTAAHTVRFTPHEHAALAACAKATHLSLTDFIRKAALDELERQRKPKP